MTPVLLLWCQRRLSSMYFPPPSGALRSAVVDHVDFFSCGAEGGRDALTGLLGVLSKAMIPSFSIATLSWSWLGSKAPGFAFCCAEEVAFPPSDGHSCSSCALPGIRAPTLLSGSSEITQFGQTLWSCFGIVLSAQRKPVADVHLQLPPSLP